MSDAVDVIINRQSARVEGPAPDELALQRAFAAAAAAPDHKRLTPWRFIVVADAGRAALGDLLARSLQAREPGVESKVLDRERAKAQRAPLVVIAAAVIKPEAESMVPEVEQILAAGAATENFILAMHGQGYSAAWKTGDAAYCPVFKQGLGLSPADHVLGILYVGRPAETPPPRPRQAAAEFVRHWP